jgi:hypothetical protein
MSEVKEHKLQSGATLKIYEIPWMDCKALYQAFLDEVKTIAIKSDTQMAQLYKDIFCLGFASKKIEECIWTCFKKVQYCDERGELKIDKDTFQPVKARGDYIQVCMIVTKEAIDPFVKGLYAESSTFFELVASVLK